MKTDVRLMTGAELDAESFERLNSELPAVTLGYDLRWLPVLKAGLQQTPMHCQASSPAFLYLTAQLRFERIEQQFRGCRQSKPQMNCRNRQVNRNPYWPAATVKLVEIEKLSMSAIKTSIHIDEPAEEIYCSDPDFMIP